MVRVFIKGGVWKNSEDEILKAAVMKYGKQQWARVASLLNRKSAKQCKARWNEWLDPSVRKVEWSREEDEKLLHLAKLMPAQWRTIGPLVGGRTAVQCQERYETLLDEAATKTGEQDEAADGAGASMGDGGGARKLRAGDIDPHPETKPARPDPIDMDEDEIEMLQEARARLANTQGKKAKRKAREKMLNEAKRLADLQKRRELKQAGLLSSAARTKARGGKKRRREIDLGVEIPFHKPAPAGFHSTADEDVRADQIRNKRLKEVDFKKVNEAQYRSREREAKSAEKREEARLRALERSNMQYVVAEVSKKNDPTAARKRGVLTLPEPSITDSELEKVAKLSREQRLENASMMSAGEGGSATDALLGDYTDRPLPTPMRTPMTGSGVSSQEVIMREASNLRMLEKGQTPLLGGDNPELISGGTGTGALLKGETTAGSATPMIGGSATPMTTAERSVANQTPNTITGPRDQLGLNRPSSQKHPGSIGGGGEIGDDVSISGTSFTTSIGDHSMSIKQMAIAERRAKKRAQKALEAALANLPAPQFEYELAAPSAVTDDDDDEGNQSKMVMEKDAEEIEAEEIARLEKEAAKLHEKRSSVVKREDLPRPFGAINDDLVSDSSEIGMQDKKAYDLVREEMITLLKHDAFAHPMSAPSDAKLDSDKKKKRSKKDKKKRKKGATIADAGPQMPQPLEQPLEYFADDTLDMAKDLLDKEYDSLIQEKRQLAATSNNVFHSNADFMDRLHADTIQASMENASDQVFLEEKGWVSAPGDTSDSILSSLKTEFTALKETTESIRKQANKLETKLSIKNGGYMKRSEAVKGSIMQSFAELSHSKIEEKVYIMLHSTEEIGMKNRVAKLEEEIERLEMAESNNQKRYGDLLLEKNRLLALARQNQQKAES